MESYGRKRAWKKGPTRGKGGPQTAACGSGRGASGWRRSASPTSARLWLGSFATAEEAALAYDEAARRLYVPDAVLNLPHLRAATAHQRLRWLPASARGPVAAVPAYGLLNLNAQHNVHVIHQRLQELNNSSSWPAKPPLLLLLPLLPSSSPCSTVTTNIPAFNALPAPMSCFQALEQAMATAAMTAVESTPCEGACAAVADKPQLDLKEFLQQIGVLKTDEDCATGKEGVHGDCDVADTFGLGGNGQFDWDALAADMSDMAGVHGVAVSINGGFHMDDLHEVDQIGCLPIPVWDM